MEMIKRFFKDEEGATAVEYGLMVALVAMGIVVTVGLLGGKLDDLFKAVNTILEDNTPAG
jgi:pilus assembly protein Flp/PilA